MSDIENTQDEKMLWLLNENSLRRAMKNLYNAILSGENARLLQTTEEPWNIDSSKFVGSTDSEQGMHNLCKWLENIKNVAINEDIYKEQFIKPIQLVAKTIEEFRQLDNKSTNLEGWVFAKSKPTSDRYGNLKPAVTAIVPKLQSAMSINIEETSEQLSRKYYMFNNCQPIALVNRIHQTKGEMKPMQKNVLLSEFDFLFIAFEDVKEIGNSIEMENFCEIGSGQIDSNRRLGFPFVTFAKIISFNEQNITLKDINAEELLNAEINDDYYEELNHNLEKFIGMTVRIFGVQWYNTRTKKVNISKNPEIFLIQEENDIDRLRFENFIGTVRLRFSIDKSKIEKNTENEKWIEEFFYILDDIVQFKYSITNDRICNVFINTEKQIRKLREILKSPEIIRKDDIIDENKKKNELIKKIKQDHALCDILINFKVQMDHTGTYKIEKTLESLDYLSKLLIERKINHMKDFGMLKEDMGIKNTKKGDKILMSILKNDLSKILNDKNIININGIANGKIPPSILLKYLRKMEEYKPVILDKQKTEIFWIVDEKISKQEYEMLFSEYENIKNSILNIMLSREHPLTLEKISEIMKEQNKKIMVFVIDLLLREIEKTGKVKKITDSWEYTTEGRLEYMFQTYRNDTFDIDIIFEKINIGTKHTDEVEHILNDFSIKKFITKLDGKWTLAENIQEKKQRYVILKIRNYVLALLNKMRNVDKDIAIRRIEGMIIKTNCFSNGIERRRAIELEIKNMINEEIIKSNDNMLSKK